MREPSLQKTALLSAALHLIVFSLTILVLKQSNLFIIPSPYTVNLVSPDVLHKSVASRGKDASVIRDTAKSIDQTAVEMKSKKNEVKDRQKVQEILSIQQLQRIILEVYMWYGMISQIYLVQE